MSKLKKDAKCLIVHHSSGDWDFTNAQWELSTATYHSAPTSLHFLYASNDALVKVTTIPIANVKEGIIETWIYGDTAHVNFRLYFRRQDSDNYYCVDLFACSDHYQSIIKRKAGSETTLAQILSSWLPLNTWTKVRVTWWNDYVGIVIRLEYWDGSAWQTILQAYDVANEWQSIGGRVGLGSPTYQGRYWWIDDTAIYGIY